MEVTTHTIERKILMSHYHHLTMNERESLLLLYAQGKSKSEIARQLHRSVSTITRELKRNGSKSRYSACEAQKKYEKRRKACRRKKLLEQIELQKFVYTVLSQLQWSPEQISAWLKKCNLWRISYTTIYRAIHSGFMEPVKKRKGRKERFPLEKHLRRKGKPRKCHIENRGKITISHSIEERPIEANQRSEIGHLEVDCIEGKKGGACLVTLIDRQSRFMLAGKANKHNSQEVTKTLCRLLSCLPPEMRKSITADRGKEFSYHADVTRQFSGLPFYFTHPGCPWEKPSIEYANGLLRQYFPKRSSFDDVSEDAIITALNKLNFRPRKSLLWLSPLSFLLLHFT